jgi:hypothetical protein
MRCYSTALKTPYLPMSACARFAASCVFVGAWRVRGSICDGCGVFMVVS